MVMQNICPCNEIDKIRLEFVGLKAESMTRHKYTFRFNELARLASHLVATEETRMRCYLQGLSQWVLQLGKSKQAKD